MIVMMIAIPSRFEVASIQLSLADTPRARRGFRRGSHPLTAFAFAARLSGNVTGRQNEERDDDDDDDDRHRRLLEDEVKIEPGIIAGTCRYAEQSAHSLGESPPASDCYYYYHRY